MAEGSAVISELGIYRSAQVLVERHGEDVAIEVTMRANASLEAGDVDSGAVPNAARRPSGDRIYRPRRMLDSPVTSSGVTVN
jgi:hypothetical protein